MWRRLRVLALVLVLAGCSSSTWPGYVLGSAGPDVSALRVTGTETVRAEGPVRLSPDGFRLLRLFREPCVTALDGSGERCVDRERVSADLTRAAWSPDGTRLAFTDDFWRQFREPDVWVFDVTSGELRNLTDDGQDKFDVSGDDNDRALIDLLPSWSPDGETVRFARGRQGASSVDLVSVPAGGGEVSTIRSIRCEVIQLSALAWSAEQVAWTCGMPEPDVSLGDQSGGGADVVLPGAEGEDRMLLSFSPDGEWLLVDSANQYLEFSEPVGGKARAVPTGGGDPVPVAEGKVGFPTWSPGGHALAYVDLPGTLNVVAEPGGEPRELRTAERFAAADGMRLYWTPGRLLVFADEDRVLLTLAD